MALDAFVDSVELDWALTLIANAIRLRNGGDALIPWYHNGMAGAGLAQAVMQIESGGLKVPDTAYTAGTFTLTSQRTSTYSISHGLGQAPGYVIVFRTAKPSGNAQWAKFNYNGDSYGYCIYGSGIIGNGANASRYRTGIAASTISLNCDSSYPLAAGTYVWFAFREVTT